MRRAGVLSFSLASLLLGGLTGYFAHGVGQPVGAKAGARVDAEQAEGTVQMRRRIAELEAQAAVGRKTADELREKLRSAEKPEANAAESGEAIDALSAFSLASAADADPIFEDAPSTA
jgi:hypothetical protein